MDILFETGDTFDRWAEVWQNKFGKFVVSYTDWKTRFGGSSTFDTLEDAKALALHFVNRTREFIFDDERGLMPN